MERGYSKGRERNKGKVRRLPDLLGVQWSSRYAPQV